jgi:DNA-binding beta-propeller fold protein YncE
MKNSFDRRAFLLGGTVAIVLPLAACGGGGGGGGDAERPAVVSQKGPMSAPVGGVQFQVIPEEHTLVVRPAQGAPRSLGGVGRAAGQLNYPMGVTVVNGLAYVVEKGNHRVQVFDATGVSKSTFGEEVLLYPGGITSAQAEIFVSDSRNGRVAGFTPEGRLTRFIGEGHLSAPRGLVYVDGELLVADPGLREVLRIGRDGRVLGHFGQWVLPWDVATDGTHVYVADVSANAVVVLSTEGRRLDELKLQSAPRYLAFREGTLYVA